MKDRLNTKKAHIQEQIESLKLNRGIVGKHNSDMLDLPDEIKFQFWRISVIDRLLKSSKKKIRDELSQLQASGITTALDKTHEDLLKYALGELG